MAVSPDDDPAADLQRSHGRFLYFAPDELEPIDPADAAEHHRGPRRGSRSTNGPEEETT